MKYAKAHPKLLYTYSLLAFLVCLLLIELITPAVLTAYRAHWAVLAVVLLLCVTPFGNNKLVANAQEKPRHAVQPWLLRLFALQLALFFVFIGMTLVYSHWLPLTSSLHTNTIRDTVTTLLKHDGLLPWGIYALYAGGLGFVAYVKNQDAYAGDLILPLFHKKPESLLSNAFNLQARAANFAVLAASFAFMTLLIAALITPRAMPLLMGFHIKTMLIILALILLGFTRPFKKIIKKLLPAKIPLSITLTTTVILFALLIWLLNAFFGHLGQAPIKTPRIMEWLEQKNPATLWMIFSAAWWIGWTPLIAAHMARLSRGYRIRSMMLACLFLPLLLTVLTMQFPTILNALQDFPVSASILSIIAFIYLLTVLTKKTVLPLMIRCYLPRRDVYKRRDHYFYCRKLFQVMLIVIYLYLPAGISLAIFVVFAMGLGFTLQVLLNLIVSLSQLKKQR